MSTKEQVYAPTEDGCVCVCTADSAGWKSNWKPIEDPEAVLHRSPHFAQLPWLRTSLVGGHRH